MLVRDHPNADTAGAVPEANIEPMTLTGHPDHFAARHIGPDADEARAMQDILYLHAAANSPISEVLAMRIVESGEISDGPENPADWPYQSVLEAIRDGWRVVKFPELALMMDESRTYSLGFEFILERNGGLR